MRVPLHAEHVIKFKKSTHTMGTSVAIMIKIMRQMTIIVGHVSELFPMLPAKPKNIIKQLELNFFFTSVRWKFQVLCGQSAVSGVDGAKVCIKVTLSPLLFVRFFFFNC